MRGAPSNAVPTRHARAGTDPSGAGTERASRSQSGSRAPCRSPSGPTTARPKRTRAGPPTNEGPARSPSGQQPTCGVLGLLCSPARPRKKTREKKTNRESTRRRRRAVERLTRFGQHDRSSRRGDRMSSARLRVGRRARSRQVSKQLQGAPSSTSRKLVKQPECGTSPGLISHRPSQQKFYPPIGRRW